MIGKKNLDSVDKMAYCFDWVRLDYQKEIEMVSYKKDAVRINIYLDKGMVTTSMNHLKKGKTQLFRRDVNMNGLKKIFKNPRVHTGSGYYTR